MIVISDDVNLEDIEKLAKTYDDLPSYQRSGSRRVEIVGHSDEDFYQVDLEEHYFRHCRYDIIKRAVEIIKTDSPGTYRFELRWKNPVSIDTTSFPADAARPERVRSTGWYCVPCDCHDGCPHLQYTLVKDTRNLVTLDVAAPLTQEQMKQLEHENGF